MRLGLLPPNLANVAKLCAENPRYALSGPRLTLTDTGYRVDATDGRRLLTVTGDYPDPPADYPELPALASAPNGAASAIIPTKDWQAAFKMLPKARLTRQRPILGNLAAVIGETVTTFGSTDMESTQAKECRNVEGRYPAVEEIKPPVCQTPTEVHVDPRMLAELLSVLSDFTDDENKGITLKVYPSKPGGYSQPLWVEVENRGQKVTACLMPYGK